MGILHLVDQKKEIRDFEGIRDQLAKFKIVHARWDLPHTPSDSATQDEVLAAYSSYLKPFMAQGHYQSADVIMVNAQTPNLPALREKFLAEHIHTEDEIRFFVGGQGLFWFNVEGVVMSLLCQAGDLISVPAGYKHWFDLGPNPHLKAIRIFTNPDGWVAQYTNSGIDKRYNPTYKA